MNAEVVSFAICWTGSGRRSDDGCVSCVFRVGRTSDSSCLGDEATGQRREPDGASRSTDDKVTQSNVSA